MRTRNLKLFSSFTLRENLDLCIRRQKISKRMIDRAVGVFTFGLLLLHVNAAPPAYIPPPDDFGINNSSESNEWPTIPDHLCTTVTFPRHKLRGVPADIKDFWGEMYVYINVVWVLGKDLCKQINLCDKMDEKINVLINRTMETIEAEIKVILNEDWPTRKESTAQYQIACAERLTSEWQEIIDAWEAEMKNRNPYEQKLHELRETRLRFIEVKRDLARRIKDLKQVVGKEKLPTS